MEAEKTLPKFPFSVGDRASYIRKAAVALETVMVPIARVVTFSVARSMVEVADIPLTEIAPDPASKNQFYVDGYHVSGGPASMAKTHLSWLRSQALNGGATPDAIRLLSKATGAFTKKEEAIMAEKLKTKASVAKPDKEGLKAGAKAAPAGGAKKNKGNPAALAKARAAKGPDNRKIKVLNKKPEARENSYRARMLKDLLASKTVQEFRDKDKAYSAGDVAYAIKANIISVA
jgi:hypothetical protein